jgi:putative transposase
MLKNINMTTKVIKCGVVGLTNNKKECLDSEWSNFQDFLQLKNTLWWKNDWGKNIYSANKQQAERFYKSIEEGKEYPISIRKDLIQIEKKDTKLAKYWFRMRVKSKRNLWLAIKPHQPISDDVEFQESKLLKKNGQYFIYLTIQKEIKIKKSYSNILSIDLGVKWIATVCDMKSKRPVFYGKELRGIRGKHFYLRRKIQKKKIRQMGKWLENNKEERIVNDLIHKISRDIVNKAKETNSMICWGDIKGIRKNNKGRKFNRKLNSFPFYKLKEQIRYKAEWEGIKVVEISEAWTSQICNKCSEKGTRNKGLFKCNSCGYEDNSDRNGSLNIGKRVLGQVSRIGVSVNIPKTEAENIKNTKIRNSVSDFRSHLFQ